LAFGYVVRFTEATSVMGRSLGDSKDSTENQDAITPPGFSTLYVFIFSLSLVAIVMGFVIYGGLAGVGIIFLYLFLAIINRMVIIPSQEHFHFTNRITSSMLNRYSKYSSRGNDSRAQSMRKLLDKAGIKIPKV